ncbi:MAG: type II secretion system F family protein [Microbacteriaceae bacterium]|nr:type II secretion system F family protein [Microbacteriaceae bacterium]
MTAIPASSVTAWAVFWGICFGFGCWAMLSLMPQLNRPPLMHRVAPYLVDVSPAARELLARRAVNPLPVLGTLLGPLADRLKRLLGSVLGGSRLVRVRLRQSGSTLSADGFRAQQLVWGVAGLAIGIAAAAVLAQYQPIPILASVSITVACAVSGIFLRDYLLGRAASARLSRMTSELPTVLEFLTLSLSAGEGILDGLRRISRISRGELATELGLAVSAVNAGIPFAQSLRRLSVELELAPLTRTVEQMVGALERGTPLVEVLRAQAQDSRDEAKRSLLETAGKKEVAMLVPLVFLILPITIVFAIFPGIFVLRLGF